MAAASDRKLATAADLAGREADKPYLEIVNGVLVPKAAPSFDHGFVQLQLSGRVGGAFSKRGGGPPDAPGGWWVVTECHIELETHQVFCPDLTGWRRDRVPERPRGMPVRIRPDWVGEILSPSNARNDVVTKLQVLQRCAVPHYWIADPEREVLTVYRWTAEGYLLALQATRGQTVRAEPFDAIDLRVGALFGEEPEE